MNQMNELVIIKLFIVYQENDRPNMLKVSSNNIAFNQSQTIKSLTLQNQFPNNIIFKIKVSTVGHLSIEPNKGFIRANSSVPFIIKSLQNHKFQVKVLFTYGFITSKNHEFNQEWDQIKQNGKFEHSIIQVKRVEPYKTNPKMGRVNQKIETLLKPSSKPSNSSQVSQTNMSPRKVSMEKRGQKSVPRIKMESVRKMSPRKEQQSYEEFSQQMYVEEESRDECLFYTSEQMNQLIEDGDKFEKLFEAEKINNKKLMQQLSISEAKLKEVTEDKMHIETHKSIGIVCEDYHTTFTFLVIIGLTCFVFGFFLGKVEASIV